MSAAAMTKITLFRIEAMDCPTEESVLRSKFATLEGIVDLEFNLMQRTLKI